MSNYFKSYLIIVATTLLFCNCSPDVDRCADKLANGINPKPIIVNIDAWITDEQNGLLELSNSIGELMNVQLEVNLSDSIDVECLEVISG